MWFEYQTIIIKLKTNATLSKINFMGFQIYAHVIQILGHFNE